MGGLEREAGDVPRLVRVAKALLWIVSWGVTIWWFSLWFRLPSDEGRAWRREVSAEVLSPFWGKYASNYILYVAPVIALAILALVYLELEEQFPERVRSSAWEQSMFVRLYRAIWTQPLFVRTPVGVVTFIDVAIVVIVFVCAGWIWGELLVPQFAAVDAAKPKPGYPKWALKWDKTSDMLGRALPFTIAVLFIPVARGSPILRLIDVPFEQAVKYHRWFGYLTVLLVIVHGATYGVYAGAIHQLELLIEWPFHGTSNLAGTISCIAAMAMGATSVPYVRSRHFNTFFNTHQLYLVFFVFYVFHVDWNHVGQSMGPVFLFFIDRFLRMVQSRRRVTGVSARVLPSGLVELKIPRRPGFKYSALSFLYLHVPGISRLQWHPFSTSSSPLDDNNEVSVCIKPLGDWTSVLHGNVVASSNKMSGCPFAVSLNAEGPYGHETNYFLRYRNLILVAGGAGVTPYLAIIQDLMKRHQLQQEGLPSNVQLIWCVKRASELATLRLIRRGYHQSTGLALDIQAYVTGETETGGRDVEEMEKIPLDAQILPDVSPQKKTAISTVNSYQNLWMMALILASMTGFVLMSALFYNYVTAPKLFPKGKHFSTALETILHFVCMFVGIVICGGSVIFFWVASDQARSGAGYEQDAKTATKDLEGNDESTLFDSCIITQGSRPQFQELFKECAEKHEGEEVGVLVCGPESLQASVAEACRSRNFASLMKTPFHYHSVSFDL